MVLAEHAANLLSIGLLEGLQAWRVGEALEVCLELRELLLRDVAVGFGGWLGKRSDCQDSENEYDLSHFDFCYTLWKDFALQFGGLYAHRTSRLCKRCPNR